MNRNGQDDPNGWWPVISPDPQNPYYYYNPNNPSDLRNGQTMPNIIPGDTLSNLVVGDPEWVGVLQHPDQPYGPNNPFVARYAFVAVPIGNALDLNAIHNQVLDENGRAGNGKTVSVNPSSAFGPGDDAFMRNQGVGSWEINLAAFLADLNTNQWGQVVGSGANPPVGSATWYQYNEANPNPSFNQGFAFDDARALLAYRYNNNYLSLKSAGQLFPNMPAANTGVFPFDNIDEYSDGPLQTAPAPINEVTWPPNRDNPTLPWAGADNINQFFDLQELFTTNQTEPPQTVAPPGFTDRLLSADNRVSTYDRYTYYRLLAQMGVDSAPEQGKLNLNYLNVDANGNVVPDLETNLIPWTALQFFTNAADRMLRAYSQEWLKESPSSYLATYGSYTNIGTFANPTNIPLTFGISHIPVFVDNQFVYKPAVQRVLQLAANIYDATTNNSNIAGNSYNYNFPSVFRPTFLVAKDPVSGFTNVYIVGYEPVGHYYDANGQIELGTVTGPGDPQLALPVEVTDLISPIPDPPNPVGYGPGFVYTNVNVYGVPWIIGAKKGFPNFNKFDMESAFQLTRKLQVRRDSTNDQFAINPGNYHFDQMFNLSLSNQFGVECWNSYANSFNDSVAIYVRDNLRHAALTNDEDFSADYPAFPIASNIQTAAVYPFWPGYNPVTYQQSFEIPLYTNVTVITNSTYIINGLTYNGITYPPRSLTTNQALPFETGVNINGNLYPQPHWFLTTSNEFQVYMLDTTVNPNRVIDYVQLSGPNSVRDLTSEIITNWDVPANTSQASGSEIWNTNSDQNGVPIGILSLVGVSMGLYTPSSTSGAWNASGTQRADEIAGFSTFMGYTPPPPYVLGEVNAIALAATSLSNQAPYLPTATVVQHVSWQANDPLVHYLASDLNWPDAVLPPDTKVYGLMNGPGVPAGSVGLLGTLNPNYQPWGTNLPPPEPGPFNLAVKDPLVWRSDYWDFPSYKFPSVGWLGRVHRGTPWQTVYLKAADIMVLPNTPGVPLTTNYWPEAAGTNVLVVTNTNPWLSWSGDSDGNGYDAVNTAPVQDRLLFDIFSTAPNNNATLGQLSVNVDAGNPSPQAGLAAWSALFSGVVVPTNTVSGYTVVNPAGPVNTLNPPPLWQIVTNINGTRANFVNVDGLTNTFEHVGDIFAVPDLTYQSPYLANLNLTNAVSDELYEWLPEQVMSLLHVSAAPRFVIYSYGQTLKPAPNGINTANITLANGQSAFGMVTNYQVVAEAATRAVVRFGSARVDNVVLTNDVNGTYWQVVPSVTNNNAVIEQFNVLPAN